eukprot:4135427-Pyramimonas_sp.AAC.1
MYAHCGKWPIRGESYFVSEHHPWDFNTANERICCAPTILNCARTPYLGIHAYESLKLSQA